MDLLGCPSCRGVLWDPVTVSCGHSFCRRCLGGGELPSRCPCCQQRLLCLGIREVRCNVLLGSLLDKCLDRDLKAAHLRTDLRERLRASDYPGALRAAQNAVLMVPQDVSLRLERAEVYIALQKYLEALEDLNMVCRIQPKEPEGFCRKAEVLALMGQRMESLRQLHQCLIIDPNFSPARKELEKVLPQDVPPLPEDGHTLLGVLTNYLDKHSSGTEDLIVPLRAASVNDSDDASGSQCLTGESIEDASIGPCITGQPYPPILGTTICETAKRKDQECEKESVEERLIQVDLAGPAVLTSSSLRDRLSVVDFECSLCVRMFLEPVTTPCGHTFCKECLERCLDHRPCCPLCKQSLREYLKDGRYTPTEVLKDIMAATFPAELSERKTVHDLEIVELSNPTTDVPIFVCTMAFPGIACPLHIFEPRYRLMIRRCQDTGTKRFGMCVYQGGKSFADFGCMLEILRLEYLADGRSLVDTIGRRRFRVLKKGHRDGYHTADVEYLEDKKVEGEELIELQRLHSLTYQQVEGWISEDRADLSRPSFLQSGPLPKMEDDIQASPDGPAWCWWLLASLPLDPSYQTMILSLTSLKDRLMHMKHILSVFTKSQAEASPASAPMNDNT